MGSCVNYSGNDPSLIPIIHPINPHNPIPILFPIPIPYSNPIPYSLFQSYSHLRIVSFQSFARTLPHSPLMNRLSIHCNTIQYIRIHSNTFKYIVIQIPKADWMADCNTMELGAGSELGVDVKQIHEKKVFIQATFFRFWALHCERR